MRGHSLSGSRKLNRHWQSGGAGTPPGPVYSYFIGSVGSGGLIINGFTQQTISGSFTQGAHYIDLPLSGSITLNPGAGNNEEFCTYRNYPNFANSYFRFASIISSISGSYRGLSIDYSNLVVNLNGVNLTVDADSTNSRRFIAYSYPEVAGMTITISGFVRVNFTMTQAGTISIVTPAQNFGFYSNNWVPMRTH